MIDDFGEDRRAIEALLGAFIVPGIELAHAAKARVVLQRPADGLVLVPRLGEAVGGLAPVLLTDVERPRLLCEVSELQPIDP